MSSPHAPGGAGTVPALARGVVDRAAKRRTDAEWLADAWKRALVLVVDDGRALVADDALVLVDAAEAPEGERLFLGEDTEGTPYFAVMAELPEREGARAANVREVGHLLDDRDTGLMMTAAGLWHWHAGHRYSPVTGAPSRISDAGWVRMPQDGPAMWPRTDPAVIVLVNDGVPGPAGRCLLGRNAQWPGRRFSCLAGFVEPGESAEAAVAREVAEEVGVTVRELRYMGSQAWPFPGSLMLGFTALADPAEPIVVDVEEIAEARWVSRAELSRGEVNMPAPASIAHFLVSSWLASEV